MVFIVGPTAVGKTEICLQIAEKLDAEIFSCDSRQFYKELQIGTAKPTTEELAKVPHHFINNLSIDSDYTASDFEEEALEKLRCYFEKKEIAIMTGGSGLFVRAITDGFDAIPDIPNTIRQTLKERIENGEFATMVEELKVLDPEYCKTADLANKQRLTRALAVCLHTKKSYSFWLKKSRKERPFNIIKIGLERSRAELYERINSRADAMLKEGFVDEVKSLVSYRKKNALQTVGYKEIFSFFDGKIDYETMVNLIKQNTRRYAKRQITWFRNKDTFQWFHPNDLEVILAYIHSRQK